MNQQAPGAAAGTPGTPGTPGMPQIYDLDMDQINHDADNAGGESQFFNLVPGRTWVFFLPPWSAQRLLAKPVYRCFLKDALGEQKTHVAWKTHESVQGSTITGAADPVLGVLNELKGIIGETDAIRASWPRCRYYANVVVYGTQEGADLSKLGDIKTMPPQVSILQFPKGVYDALVKKIREIGSIVNPQAAVCVGINKTGKGLKTEYSVAFSGNESPQGFQAIRENLFEKDGFGPDVMNDILSNLVDIDGIFKAPLEAQVAETQQLTKQLRTALSAGGAVAGAFSAPGGGMGMGMTPPPPVGQGAPGTVSVPGPQAGVVPPTTAPAVTAPAAPALPGVATGVMATPPAPPPAG